jgi:hypothetical protein
MLPWLLWPLPLFTPISYTLFPFVSYILFPFISYTLLFFIGLNNILYSFSGSYTNYWYLLWYYLRGDNLLILALLFDVIIYVICWSYVAGNNYNNSFLCIFDPGVNRLFIYKLSLFGSYLVSNFLFIANVFDYIFLDGYWSC